MLPTALPSAPFPLAAARLLALAAVPFAAVPLAGCGADAAPPPPGPNFLIVTIDTLRADYLEPYGDEAPISPAIAALAKDGTVFERAWSTSSWTLPSLASLHTGLLSTAHGCWRFGNRLDLRFETLAERLAAAGWDTAGVVNHVFLGRKHGLNQGFVHYDDELVEDFGPSHEAITSRQVADKGVAFLEAKAAADDGRPWLLWLHFFDPHEVYHFHEQWSPPFGTETDRELYRGEIAFTDHHVGRVLTALRERGFADDTVVLVAADHGEEWEEHGALGHGFNLHRETVHIPFILRVPGVEPARVATRVSLVDVAPTLLELAGQPPLAGGLGRSLVPALRGQALDERPVLAELHRRDREGLQTSIGRDRWKLIHHEQDDRVELYDVVADPGEQRDLATEEPRVVEELLLELRALRALAAERAPVEIVGGEVALGAAELEALEALGYVEDE